MRNITTYAFVLLLVGTYIVSTMGFGVHKCTKNGTKEMVVLFAKDLCKSAHGGSSKVSSGTCGCKCKHCCSDANKNDLNEIHTGRCCTTDVYVLSHDQVNSQQQETETPFSSALGPSLFNTAESVLYANVFSFSGMLYSSGFIKVRSLCSLIISISQFRI